MATGTVAERRPVTPLLLALLAGAAVSVGLGVYGRVHDPTGEAIFTLFFTGTINLKTWFTTLALVLVAFQLYSALRLWGKVTVPAALPSWFGDAHRLSGTLAFLVSLPVAYHCLWALGFEADADQTRRFVHSLFGCFFYGIFVVKVFAVRRPGLPSWVLPVVGGATFAALVVIWYTSALWFFQQSGFPSI